MRSPRNKVLVLACMFAAFQAHAETYYVSPTGTATWTQCTNINTPCNGRTAVQSAVAGDLVYFRGGTYDPAATPIASWAATSNTNKWEVLPWNPSNSGTADAPITFKAYPGETPVFLDNIYSGTLGAVNRNFIIWDGFSGTIVDSLGQVIVFAYFSGTNNCIIRNSNFTGVPKASHHNSSLISLLNNSNILIENNRLHDMNDDGLSNTEEANNSTAILSYNSRNMIIRNNDIYNNYFGIFDKDIEQNNSYYRNHIWGGNTSATACRVGIQIHEQEVYFGAATNSQAFQNVIRNCWTGASIMDNTSLPNNGTKIYNNVIFNNLTTDEQGIFVNTESVGAEIYNNIIDGYSIPMRYYATMSENVAYSDYNLFFNSIPVWWTGFTTSYSTLSAWRTASTFDTHSLQTDPQYVGTAGSTNPYDYRLDSGSPAIGTGRNGVNIGAYPASNSLGIGWNPVKPKAPLLSP